MTRALHAIIAILFGILLSQIVLAIMNPVRAETDPDIHAAAQAMTASLVCGDRPIFMDVWMHYVREYQKRTHLSLPSAAQIVENHVRIILPIARTDPQRFCHNMLSALGQQGG